jgi:hypothetical protein
MGYVLELFDKSVHGAPRPRSWLAKCVRDRVAEHAKIEQLFARAFSFIGAKNGFTLTDRKFGYFAVGLSECEGCVADELFEVVLPSLCGWSFSGATSGCSGRCWR